MSLLSVPLGSVLMYWAEAANETLPSQYAYCDGSTLTSGNHDVPDFLGNLGYNLILPDFRNRFPVGADRTKAFGVSGDTSNAAGPGGTGGSHSITLTIAHLPHHTHPSSTDSQGAHTHTFTVNGGSMPSHAHTTNPGGYLYGGTDGLTANPSSGIAVDTALYPNGSASATTSAGAHAHTVFSDTQGSHSHTVTVNSTGSGTAWDSRPNFYGVVFIMKVRR